MDYREIARLKGDNSAVRSRAAFILATQTGELSEGAMGMLNALLKLGDDKAISTRQGEALQNLYGRATKKRVVAGYNVALMVRNLLDAKYDLEEDQVELLEGLEIYGNELAVTEAQWGSLCRMRRTIWPDFEFVPFR